MAEIVIDGKILRQFDPVYYVGEYGDIYSTYSKKFLKHSIDLNGYHRVDIHRKHMKVHKLVFLTWVRNVPEDMQINHRDDNKNNNHYTNLYAGSQKDNVCDCIRNGHRKGNIHYLTVLDKKIGKVITFSPCSDFIEYSGHPCGNRSVKRMFSKNWFKTRYEIIDYSK